MASAASAQKAALVLEVDPDLGADIDPAEWDLVRRVCCGELVHVPSGAWAAANQAAERNDLIAFVIVDGVLAREVSLRDHCMVELLGHGDVLQPRPATDVPRLGRQMQLTAVGDLSLLALGSPFVRAAVRWPTLLTALLDRINAQRERLAIQGLIAHLPTARHRALLMLRHLADRWGYVTPDGVVLPWPLNHEILGRLVAARRSTITLALGDLEASGAVHRRDDGSWLLTPTAERMIDAVARPPGVPHSIGQRLLLFQQMAKTTAEARALQAEAQQVRS